MTLRNLATAVTVALACLAWTAVATADNPHGTPPGQAKADASATANANAQVGAEEHANGAAKGEAGVNGHVHASVGVKANGHAHGNVNGQAHGNVNGHARGKGKASAGASAHTVANGHVHGAGHVNAKGHAGGSVHAATKATASANGHGTVAAATSGQTKLHGNGPGHARGKLRASGHNMAALAAALGVGVKSSGVTGKNTVALASSNQTKLYGNGMTAGQIATQAGLAAGLLFGPGNSQPHKVMCGTHMIDVHALKANAGGCGTAEVAAALHGHARGKLRASSHNMAALAAALGAGVKPSGITGNTTIALASSNQTKLYGNGMTAGQIATQAGLGGALLFGPGNSQPHKVMCGSHMIDVHALKANAGACKAAGVVVGLTASGTPIVAPAQASAAAPAAAPVAAAATTTSSPAAAGNTGGGGGGGVAPARARHERSQGPTAQLAAVKTAVNRAITAPVRTGTLPFTGMGLLLPLALGIALIGSGFALRRKTRTLA